MRMTQCGFKQQFLTKASFESKEKWANDQDVILAIFYANIKKKKGKKL